MIEGLGLRRRALKLKIDINCTLKDFLLSCLYLQAYFLTQLYSSTSKTFKLTFVIPSFLHLVIKLPNTQIILYIHKFTSCVFSITFVVCISIMCPFFQQKCPFVQNRPQKDIQLKKAKKSKCLLTFYGLFLKTMSSKIFSIDIGHRKTHSLCNYDRITMLRCISC